MRIDFKHISIEGFMSIGQAEIDLSDNGLVLVSGINTNPSDNSKSNGSGKSSIFEAIFYAATGYTIRGSKDIVNRNYPKGCKLELTLARGNDIFKIVRSRSHHELGTKVLLFMNDEDISGKTMKDCDSVINQYIPEISWNIVSSIIILGQGLPNKLTSYSPSGRKQLLENLSQTSHLIEDVRVRVDSRKFDLNKSLSTMNSRLSEINVESATLNRVVTDIRNSLTSSVEDIDKEIMVQIDILNQFIEKSDKLKIEENSFVSTLMLLTKKKEEITNKLNQIFYTRNELDGKIKKLSNNICPTCGRPFENSNQLALEKDQAISRMIELDAEYEVVKKEKDKIESEIADIMSTKSQITIEKSKADANVINLNSKLDSLDNQKKVIQSAEADIAKHTRRLEELSAEVEIINPKKSEVESCLNSLGYIDRALSKEFKSYILENVIDYLNKKISNYSKILFTENYIRLVSSGNNLDIEVGEKSYESLSGGERQKADLCIQFALRDMLVNITGFSCNMIVLDEVFDNLDEVGCNNLLKLVTQLFSDIDSVYVITHHSDIAIPKDKELIVNKDFTNLSKVDMRVV